jgi:hypothetical protein
MSFDENRKKAIEQRRAGAEKVDSRIRKEAGDGVTLTWTDLERSEEKYPLHVSFGGTTQTFIFERDSLSDYPEGHARVDAFVDGIIDWVKQQKKR